MVYIAYRDTNPASKDVAERLTIYLRSEKGLRAFFAPWQIGWGQSLFGRLEKRMAEADAAVLCYTKDFLEGRTARQEYEFFTGKLRQFPGFVAGLVLIDVDYDDAPQPLRDRLNARVLGPDDPNFPNEADEIYRGILGLGQERRKA